MNPHPDDDDARDTATTRLSTGSSEPSPRPAQRSERIWRRIEIAVPVVGYLTAVSLGATTSSLGMPGLRQDPAQPLGRTLFEPQAIRSDEWLSQTPIELNVMINGQSSQSPLSQAPDLIYQVSSGSPVESLFFLEGNLLRLGPYLPDAQLFSAFRNLPLLLLLLTLPPLLRRLGSNRPLSWLATLLMIVAPASAWWSFMPVRIGSVATTGLYLLILARDRFSAGSRWQGFGLAVAAGIVLPRLGTYYVPWGIVIGVPLVLAVGVWLIWDRTGRRAAFQALGAGAVTGGCILALTLWENASSLHAELNTSYPGLRRAAGERLDPFQVFGAPGLFEQQNGPSPLLLNTSETTSAYAVAAVCLVVAWVIGRPRMRARDKAAAAVLTGFTLLWLSWCLIDWGPWATSIPVLNVLTPIRVSQTLGFVAVMALCVVLPHIRRDRRLAVGLISAAGGTAVTLWAVNDLQRALPTLWTGSVVLVSVATGLALFALSRWSHSAIVTIGVVALAATSVYQINPIQFGLGDLRASTTASAALDLRDTLRAEGALAASDHAGINALLVANGVPTATGYQVTGPVRDQWHQVDPSEKYEVAWNRGASYLVFDFNDEVGASPTVSNPAPDVIVVAVDPCQMPDLAQPVRVVITARELTDSCLQKTQTLRWAGQPIHVYDVR